MSMKCPGCGSTNIQSGGFTGTYYWCDTKGCSYFEAREESPLPFRNAFLESERGIHIKSAHVDHAVEQFKSIKTDEMLRDIEHITGRLILALSHHSNAYKDAVRMRKKYGLSEIKL